MVLYMFFLFILFVRHITLLASQKRHMNYFNMTPQMFIYYIICHTYNIGQMIIFYMVLQMLFMFILPVAHITRLTFKKYHLVSCLFNHVSIDVHYFFIICRTHCIFKKRAPNNIFYMVLQMFFLFILFVAHITWLINSA